MTEACDILATLCEEPESDILAAMLIDALVEERGMWHTEAEAHVAKVRLDCRLAKQIDTCAAIIAAKDGRRAFLHARIREVIGLDPYDPVTVYLVGGEEPPSGGVWVPEGPNGATPGVFNAYVPAGWALAQLAAGGHSVEPPKRKGKRK